MNRRSFAKRLAQLGAIAFLGPKALGGLTALTVPKKEEWVPNPEYLEAEWEIRYIISPGIYQMGLISHEPAILQTPAPDCP